VIMAWSRLRLVWCLSAITACVLAAAYIQIFFNPLGLGIAKSSKFSWPRFEQVQNGQPIEEVIELLGRPIREPEVLQVINPSKGGDDPCYPSACKTYRFFGRSYSSWPVLGYREAIVVVGPDGRVVNKVIREE
jgi:hypothetical protein